MKDRFIRFILAAIMMIISLALAFNTQASDQLKTALIIGNGAYKSAPLKNPVNDANDMARTLEKLGFEVIHMENASKRRMKDAIHQFGQKLKKGGVGLFYFAGHGMQVRGTNYLIPVNAHIRAESDIEFESIDAGRLLARMEEAGNEMNIVILDSCQDNPFARSFRSNSRGLARMDAPTGSFIAYATAPGDTAADGTGKNGIFTGNLLKHMTTPNLKIEDVFKRVRVVVANETSKKQIPWQSSSLMGDFYFVKNTGSDSPINQPMQVVSFDPALTNPRIVKKDRHYVKYDTGVVRDTRTGLELYAGPDKDTNWHEAKAWVNRLSVDGGGWRMPTRAELEKLYEKGVGSLNMTPLLKTNGRSVRAVWSGEEGGAGASMWYSNFSYGFGDGGWGLLDFSSTLRVFAVRSR